MCKSFVLACVAVASLLLGISGCGKTEVPTAGTQTAKVRMAGIIFQDDQFFRLILFGMRDAAKKNNVELLTGNSDNKTDTEQQLVENYAGQKVDAIIISPLDAKVTATSLKAAHDKGIVIITNNTSIAGDFPEAAVECSNADLGEQTGKAAVQYIKDKLGGKAKVAILQFKSQVPEQSGARVGGFKKSLEALGANVEYVADQDAWLADAAEKTAGDIMTAHPDVNIIYAANEGGTTGAVLAVKNGGKGGKVAVFGTDVSDQLIGFLQSPDNVLQAITAQKPYDVGQRCVEAALKALKKEPVEKKVVLTGLCLTRTDPDGIKQFSDQLKQWTASGK